MRLAVLLDAADVPTVMLHGNSTQQMGMARIKDSFHPSFYGVLRSMQLVALSKDLDKSRV